MNEDNNIYNDSNPNTENDIVYNTTTETTQSTPVYHSEPYRYRYENGEKAEAVNETPYSTYYYNNNTAFHASDIPDADTVTDTAPVTKKKKTFVKILKWTLGAACFGLIAGAAFLGVSYFGGNALGLNQTSSGSSFLGGTGTPLNITLGTTSTIEGAENPAESVVVQVVEENMAATVAVKSTFLTTYSYWGQQYQKETQGSGSGFIVGINEKELLIATNNHVIEDATKIEITFIDDTVLEATIKGTDSIADLAIIAVPIDTISAETISKIRVATLGDSDEVRLGQMAIAIGNALGYGQSVTVGYISAKDREVQVDGNTMVLLQTDAAINGGNSGGPLFNTKGEVIGINSVKYADTDVEGMCFAIPISRAIPILNELMNRETLAEEEKGFLGVSTRTVTDEIASFYGWPTGAYIVSVQEGSPAEAAGIYVADIVTSVNGVQIITADQLVDAISSYRYGTVVELKLQRLINGKYEEITINATLAQRSEMINESAEAGTITEDKSNESNTPEDSKKPRN